MYIAALVHPETFECGFSYFGPFDSFEACEAWCYIQNTDYPEKDGKEFFVQFMSAVWEK